MSGLFPVAAGYAKWYRLGTFVALFVPLIGVLIYAVLAAGLVLRSRARAAIGGGLLLTTGVWFTYSISR